MAEVFFDNPPVMNGDEKSQLLQIQRYLNAMSEKLNIALSSISIEQMDTQTAQTIRTAAGEKAQSEVTALKSMIIKTAEVVRHEMDVITSHLEDNYEALSSQFGEYERSITQDMTDTAMGVLRQFEINEKIQGLEDENGETEVFKNNFASYIFLGILDPDTGETGIAIGEDVTAYDANNNPYLNTNRKMATFTMDELAFWKGETKLAYFSNNIFFIPKGEITDSLKIGNHTWKNLGGATVLIRG